MLDPGRGKTKTGRLWCYAVDDRPWRGPGYPVAAYVYTEDRKNIRPASHLSAFRGVLQVDGYAGFKRLAGDRADTSVTLAFCWSHMRRPFYQFHASTQSPLAAAVLAEAIRYALRHWTGLTAYLDDGRIEMDTNVVERVIRPITITRKNALFAGNDGGARHWAIAMTLIQTAKLNGVEPMAYLTDVLERIVSGRTKASALEALLPWNWKASRSSATTAAQAA